LSKSKAYQLEELLPNLKQRAQQKRKENKKFFNRLKSVNPKLLDQQIHELHEDVFAQTDCLKCGNCCRTTGPLILPKDVDRLAKHLKIKAYEFEDRYTRVDEDGDRVFKSMPCPFLGEDNFCSVYEQRPKACREFPHTDRIKQHQILEITRKNVSVCPAVFEISERLKLVLQQKRAR
jgi:Fe-S-cluster containining protein